MYGLASEFTTLEKFFGTLSVYRDNDFGVKISITPRLSGLHNNKLEGFEFSFSIDDIKETAYLPWGAIELMYAKEGRGVSSEIGDFLLYHIQSVDKKNYMECGW